MKVYIIYNKSTKCWDLKNQIYYDNEEPILDFGNKSLIHILKSWGTIAKLNKIEML